MTATLDFLNAFDPNAVWELRTFDDKKGRQDKSLAQKIRGRLCDVRNRLAAINARDAGIFFVVNKGGQLDSEITEPRALFIDIDGAPLPIEFPLMPSIIVRRDDLHWHCYWLLRAGEDIKRFRDAQKQLIRFYNSDKSVFNESRVMRLPYFNHCKGAPILVTVTRLKREYWTIDEVLEAHPVEKPVAILRTAPVSSGPLPPLAFWRWAEKAAGSITPGERNVTAFKIAAMGAARGIDPTEIEGFLLRFVAPDFRSAEIARTVQSAFSKPREDYRGECA